MPALIIGLGNPGGEYAGSRHNCGWLVLDELERRGRFGRARREGPSKLTSGSIDGIELLLARPMTYMNQSGRAGAHLLRVLGLALDDVIVVHDDVDLPLGRLRLKYGGSAAGHRGVLSLIESWRTPQFTRVRVGVGRPPPGDDAIDYVLSPFRPAEREALTAVLRRAADATMAIVRDGLERAMSEYNRPVPPGTEGAEAADAGD